MISIDTNKPYKMEFDTDPGQRCLHYDNEPLKKLKFCDVCYP